MIEKFTRGKAKMKVRNNKKASQALIHTQSMLVDTVIVGFGVFMGFVNKENIEYHQTSSKLYSIFTLPAAKSA